MFCRNQLTVCKRKCFFQQPWLFFIKSEILKSDDLKNLSECCLSLKTGGMDGKKKRDNPIGRNSNLYIMEKLLKVNVNAVKFMEYVTVV